MVDEPSHQSERAVVPLTVIGGYLGAGKTTLLNRLLAAPGGRRIGVIVNDFGDIGIDVERLVEAGAAVDDVISLPNGCACCTVGADLYEALARLAALGDVLDHVVIEASGVADPAAAAAWARTEPFGPGGIVVLAAADRIRELAADRYVGVEVRRQLAGADLILVTKADLVDAATLGAVDAWLEDIAPGRAHVVVGRGDVPVDVVLGFTGVVTSTARAVGHGDHADRYVSGSWTSSAPIDRALFDAFVADLPPGLLRMKGMVHLVDGTAATVDVVGRRVELAVAEPVARADPAGSRLVAIGVRQLFDPEQWFAAGLQTGGAGDPGMPG